MARKTKSAAAIETAKEKPRNRRTRTSKAAPAFDQTLTSDRHTANSTAGEKPIAGKLGLIAKAVAKPKGASIDDLTTATGWQPHTVRAALTRLRQRGINATLMAVDDRKVYRVAEAPV